MAIPHPRKDQIISARLDGDTAVGLCHCGCGNPTRIAKRTNATWSHKKGQPVRFLPGHQNRHQEPQVRYTVQDRGYTSPCWIVASVSSTGYGQVMFNYRQLLAHRVMYERKHGPIPPGKEVDHLCRVRACCNWDHLEAVTRVVNLHRGLGTKLTEEQASAIRLSPLPQPVLAARYGVCQQTISDIQLGRRWKSLSLPLRRR